MLSSKAYLDFGLAVCGVLLLSVSTAAVGPWCFKCENALHPAICFKVVQCGEHELCHVEVTTSNAGHPLYSSSCKADIDCTTTAKRRRRRRAALQLTQCDECCAGTLCNAKGCQAQDVSNGRLFCLSCDFVQHPADCDVVDRCSLDESCIVSQQQRVGLTFFKLGCQATTSCPAPGATLARDKAVCCDTDLCNSNDLGQDPSIYTTTPIPTTRKLSPAQITVTADTVTYNVKFEPGETMDIVCHVTGGPVPKVFWTFNDGNSTSNVTAGISTGPKGFDSILSISKPTSADSGVYTCYAENQGGKDQQDITVTVLMPPHIDGNQTEYIAPKVQDDLRLPCDVNPQDNSTSVKWEISPKIRSYTINADNSLTIYNVHEENTGDYKCVAENKDGIVEKTYHVDVLITTVSPQSTIASISTSTPTSTTTSTPTTTSAPTTPTTKTSTSTTLKTTQTTTAKQTPSPTTAKQTSFPTSKPTTTTVQISSLTTPMNTNSPAGSPASAPPSAVQDTSKQFIDVNGLPVAVLQCPTTSPSVTWRRLVVDYDHTSYLYINNGNGVLAVLSQTSPDTLTGVYECEEGGVVVSQFAIFKGIPDKIACNKTFASFAGKPGDVVRVSCGPCANPLSIRPALDAKASDYICETAISKQLIYPFGGEVTYVVENGTSVRLIDTKAGNILI